jgi:pimeloyl-ACP methyl ester carboxylesterase
MPHATTEDGVKLYYEEAGDGAPILFVHEYAGDWRSWEPQMRFFARRHRCITFSFRGYPRSDVPESGALYGQRYAVADALSMLNHLNIPRAHIVGLSQGAFAAAHFGRLHADRALSLTLAGIGSGAVPDDCQWRRDFPQKWRRKIPRSGGLAINRVGDRRLRFLAAGRDVSGSAEWDGRWLAA